MKKQLLFASIFFLSGLLFAQTPQYFFQKLDCDRGNTMCFDADSNLWLGVTRAEQPLLIKMSRAGIVLEQVAIQTGAGKPNYLTALLTDSEGMIVGCGTSEPINPNDYESSFAFRYDPRTRQMLWSRKLEDNYLFISGMIEKGPGGDFIAYGYRYGINSSADLLQLERTTGNIVPAATKSYQIGNEDDIRSAIYHKGDLYTTGKNDLSYLYGIVINRYMRQSVARLDPGGSPVWDLLGSVPITTRSILVGQDILVDNDTLVSISSGNDQTNSTTATNLFLQKTTLNGQLVWLKKYDVTGFNYATETAKEIVSVSDGYVILGKNGGGTDSDFILKTDKNGNVLWAQRIHFTGNYPFAYSKSQSQLLTDGDALYFLGSAYEGQKNAAIFAKMDRNGNIPGCSRLSPINVLPIALPNPFLEKRTLIATAAPATATQTPTELPQTATLGIETVCQNEGPAPQNPCEPRSFLKKIGSDGLRQWLTCIRPGSDSTLYLAGRKGDMALLAHIRASGELLWTISLPTTEPYTTTDLLIDSEGMLVGCGHLGDAPAGRLGFVFRLNPATQQMLWLQRLSSPIARGGGIIETNTASRNLLLYQNVLMPNGQQIPESVQLNRATGKIVATTGRRYDAETHSQLFHAAALNGNELYMIGQDIAASGRQRMLLSNLTADIGGQKWLQLGHTDTTANGSFGEYGAVVFDQSSIISAYTGHPTANNATAATQFFLQKTTPLGVVVWVRRFEIPLLGELDLLAVPGGYVLMGKTSATQYILLKTDLNGNLLTSKQVDFGATNGGNVSMEKTQHRIALLGEYLFFTLHNSRSDHAFLLKTNLNLDVQGTCSGVVPLTIAHGNVLNPVANRIVQGLFTSPVNADPVIRSWQPDELAETQICPIPVVIPRLALGPDLSLCPGKTATLKASAGFASYLWQDGSTASSLTVSAAGQYSLSVRDICGARQTDTVLVTAAANPVKTVTLLLAPNSSVNLGGTLYSAPDTATITVSSKTGGCDTLVTYYLALCISKNSTEIISFYPGQKVKIGGNTYTQPGTVVLKLFTTEGCDSVVTYTLQWIVTSLQLQCSDLMVNAPFGSDRAAVEYTLPEAVTDCPDQDVLLFLLEGPYAGDTFPMGATKVCYAAASNCGIRDTCCFTVKVLPPATDLQIHCPANLTVTAPIGSSNTALDYDLPTATTDCVNPSITLTQLQGPPIGGAFQVGDTKVCYEASNACNIRDTCCFTVTVLAPDPPCDVQSSGNCIRYELLNIRLDSLGQRRYRVRVLNDCASELQYVVFQLPNGVLAASPAEASTYAAPLSGRSYAVRNPNASPFPSIRFKALTGGLKGGKGDVFEYTLPQQSVPLYFRAGVRLADGSFSEALLSTFDCPEVIENLELRIEWEAASRNSPFSILHSPFSIWPNPTDGGVQVALPQSWQRQTVGLRLLNAQGQQVFDQTFLILNEPLSLEVPLHLPEGVYWLVAQKADGERLATRVVVAR